MLALHGGNMLFRAVLTKSLQAAWGRILSVI